MDDPSVEDMDNAIKAFSKNQWDVLTEEDQCEIFAKHTIYLYGESKQRLMPNITQFNALSLSHWFDLSAKRCVHGQCLYFYSES